MRLVLWDSSLAKPSRPCCEEAQANEVETTGVGRGGGRGDRGTDREGGWGEGEMPSYPPAVLAIPADAPHL